MKWIARLALFVFVTLTTSLSWGQLSYREYRANKRIANHITRQYPPSQYLYVGVGASPTAIMAYLEITQGSRQVVHLPLTGGSVLSQIYDLDPRQTDLIDALLRRHFQLFLPQEVIGGRQVLLVDFANKGMTLPFVGERLQAALDSRGTSTSVEMLALARDDRIEETLRARGAEVYRLNNFSYINFIEQRFDMYRKYEKFEVHRISSLAEYQPPERRVPAQNFEQFISNVRQGIFAEGSYAHLLTEMERIMARDIFSRYYFIKLKLRPSTALRCQHVFRY